MESSEVKFRVEEALLLIATVGCILLITAAMKIWTKKRQNQGSQLQLKLIPSVSGAFPIIGHGYQLSKGFVNFIQFCFQAYGKIFQIKLFKWKAIIVCDWELAKSVLCTLDDRFSSMAYISTLPIICAILKDNSFSAVTKQIHRSPVKKSLAVQADVIPIIQAEAKLMIDRIKDKYESLKRNSNNGVINVGMEFHAFAANTCTHAIYGFRLDSETSAAMLRFNSRVKLLTASSLFIPDKLVPILTRTFLGDTGVKYFSELQRQVTAYRTANNTVKKRFIQECIDYRNEDYEYSDSEMVGMMAGLVFAASVESSRLMANLITDLLQNSTWLDAARKECRSCVESGDYKALMDSPLIDAIVWESYRVNMAPITLFKKIMSKTAGIGDYGVGDGDIVILSGPLIMESAGFPTTAKFNPAFLLSTEGKLFKRMLGAVNFGLGPSSCIGKQLVMFQIKAAMAVILCHMDLEIVTEESKDPTGVRMVFGKDVAAAVNFI